MNVGAIELTFTGVVRLDAVIKLRVSPAVPQRPVVSSLPSSEEAACLRSIIVFTHSYRQSHTTSSIGSDVVGVRAGVHIADVSKRPGQALCR